MISHAQLWCAVRPLLGVTALLAANGSNLAEQSITLVIGTGSEEQFRRRSIAGAAATEAESPESLNGEGRTIGIQQHAFEAAAHGVEDVNHPIAKIADQQAMAECAEVARRHGNAPGSIHEGAVLKAQKESSPSIEHPYVAKTGAVIFVSGS